MPRHRLLSRQVLRQLGLATSEQAEALVARLQALAEHEQGPTAAAMRRLGGFIDQVDQSYALYDRDLALASRSLAISSSELLEANARMRGDVEVQERALGHLRQAFHELAERAGLGDIGDDESGLEALSARLVALISARTEAERALQASEAKFRALTDLSTDWYWEQDADLRFVTTAGSSNGRGGITPQDHVGQTRWSLPYTQPVNTSWEAHRALLDARKEFHELLLRRDNAEGSHFVEVSGAPVYDSEGRFAGYRGIGRDVTARMQADAELRQAKQAADAANAAKSRFLANVSHEIRTPLNGLLGLIELMQDEAPAAQQGRLAQMAQSGQALLAIINDILDISKIEAGKLELEQIAFDPQETLQRVVASHEAQARAKRLTLHTQIDLPAPLCLLGDPLRLSQVLGNLLGNAIKFTEHGSITLRAGLRTSPDSTATAPRVLLRAEVEDTGTGISAEVAPGLFQPFTQADAGTTRRYGGTGLGLAIAKHLVEMTGGRIGLQPAPRQGSVFWAEWPFPVGSTEPAWTDSVQSSIDHWAGLEVLLVEDNAINMAVAKTQLERLNLKVCTAGNGALALQALERQRFDAVLMDCQMPVMDGFEAVRRWREIESQQGGPRHTPVIALTANTMAGDRERNLKAGFDDHLGKPFSRKGLRQVLTRWLDHRPA